MVAVSGLLDLASYDMNSSRCESAGCTELSPLLSHWAELPAHFKPASTAAPPDDDDALSASPFLWQLQPSARERRFSSAHHPTTTTCPTTSILDLNSQPTKIHRYKDLLLLLIITLIFWEINFREEAIFRETNCHWQGLKPSHLLTNLTPWPKPTPVPTSWSSSRPGPTSCWTSWSATCGSLRSPTSRSSAGMNCIKNKLILIRRKDLQEVPFFWKYYLRINFLFIFIKLPPGRSSSRRRTA